MPGMGLRSFWVREKPALGFHASPAAHAAGCGRVGLGTGHVCGRVSALHAGAGHLDRGIWRFAHVDYIQSLVEWGWARAGIWAVLFFGGMIRCFYFCRWMRSAESALLFTSGLALAGVALHALVDFPLQIASLQIHVAVYLELGWGSAASDAETSGRIGTVKRAGLDEAFPTTPPPAAARGIRPSRAMSVPQTPSTAQEPPRSPGS